MRIHQSETTWVEFTSFTYQDWDRVAGGRGALRLDLVRKVFEAVKILFSFLF